MSRYSSNNEMIKTTYLLISLKSLMVKMHDDNDDDGSNKSRLN